MGSGNGLARHLHIPMNTRKAIALLNNCRTIDIDYGLANEQLFVCTCGAGLDAEVADRFAHSAQRGFMTYLQNIIHLVFTYKAQTYHISGDGISETRKAFLVTFANANQWGNAARIAPHAGLQDGKMDIVLMSPYALWDCLPLAVRLFAGTIDRSPLIKTLRAGDVTLQREFAAPFHIDGDPVDAGKDIHIRIIRGELKALVAV
jgi:diacylglycerol kinase family enzyme